MHVFIIAVCVNLIILVDAGADIKFDSILKILKANILEANNYQSRGSLTDQHPSIIIIDARPPLFLRSDVEYESSDPDHYRARRKGSDESKDQTKSSEEELSGSEEKNPGNPYTIHKNKYQQNYPFNHYMDGDHMNINPFAPQFGSLGPSGPELFFGRKWWYYNQDDYKPMG